MSIQQQADNYLKNLSIQIQAESVGLNSWGPIKKRMPNKNFILPTVNDILNDSKNETVNRQMAQQEQLHRYLEKEKVPVMVNGQAYKFNQLPEPELEDVQEYDNMYNNLVKGYDDANNYINDIVDKINKKKQSLLSFDVVKKKLNSDILKASSSSDNKDLVRVVKLKSSIKKIDDRYNAVEQEIADLENFLNTNMQEKQIYSAYIDETKAKIDNAKRDNEKKVRDYESNLKIMNYGNFNMQQNPDETPEEYLERLTVNSQIPFNNSTTATLADVERNTTFKNNLKTLVTNNAYVEQVLNYFRTNPLEEHYIYIFNKFFPKFKESFIKNFGSNNKIIAEHSSEMIQLIKEFAESDPKMTGEPKLTLPETVLKSYAYRPDSVIQKAYYMHNQTQTDPVEPVIFSTDISEISGINNRNDIPPDFQQPPDEIDEQINNAGIEQINNQTIDNLVSSVGKKVRISPTERKKLKDNLRKEIKRRYNRKRYNNVVKKSKMAYENILKELLGEIVDDAINESINEQHAEEVKNVMEDLIENIEQLTNERNLMDNENVLSTAYNNMWNLERQAEEEEQNILPELKKRFKDKLKYKNATITLSDNNTIARFVTHFRRHKLSLYFKYYNYVPSPNEMFTLYDRFYYDSTRKTGKAEFLPLVDNGRLTEKTLKSQPRQPLVFIQENSMPKKGLWKMLKLNNSSDNSLEAFLRIELLFSNSDINLFFPNGYTEEAVTRFFKDIIGLQPTPMNKEDVLLVDNTVASVTFGAGVDNDMPDNVKLGKVMLAYKKLMLKNTLSIQNPNGTKVPGFKNATVSDEFVSLLNKLLHKEKIVDRDIDELKVGENMLFDKLMSVAQIHFKRTSGKGMASINKAKENLEIVKGQILSGNNNPAMKKDLYHALFSLVHLGALGEKQARQHYKEIIDNYF